MLEVREMENLVTPISMLITFEFFFESMPPSLGLYYSQSHFDGVVS